jgi:Uma2 family endonuclease
MAVPVVVPPYPIARFSVEQYHRMVASGAFTEHDRLELIDGWVVEKMAKGPAHEYATGRCEELLRERLPPGWHVRNQAPVTLARSEPEPDLTVALGERGAYRHRHPSSREIALVVEVADTTLATDRLKANTYAEAGIPAYWLVNLVDRCVEVYTQPGPVGYAERRVAGAGDAAPFAAGSNHSENVPVAAILP